MKFKDFLLNEIVTSAEEEYAEKYHVSAFNQKTGGASSVEAINGLLSSKEYHELGIMPRSSEAFDWPFHIPYVIDNLELGNGGTSARILTVSTFESMINAKEIHLTRNTVVTSLKGIEKLDLEDIRFSMARSDFRCGVLRLLKCEKLKQVRFTNASLHELEQLIRNAMEDKQDVVDFQSKLIDEGYEEYAKL